MLNDFIGCRGSCVPLLFKFSKIIFEQKKCAFRISVISDWIFRFLVMDGNSTCGNEFNKIKKQNGNFNFGLTVSPFAIKSVCITYYNFCSNEQSVGE